MSVLTALAEAVRASGQAAKRYGKPWIVGSIGGHLAGGAGGGVLGALLSDPHASEAERLQHAGLGAFLGWQTGGPLGAVALTSPRIMADLRAAHEALKAKTALNDMGLFARLGDDARKATTRFAEPMQKAPLTSEERRFLQPPARNSNMEGWEETIAGATKGRPFDDSQLIIGPSADGDGVTFHRPSAESYAQARWGMEPPLEFAPASNYDDALAAQTHGGTTARFDGQLPGGPTLDANGWPAGVDAWATPAPTPAHERLRTLLQLAPEHGAPATSRASNSIDRDELIRLLIEAGLLK